LRDQGYGLDIVGRLGRWSTAESAARYVQLTDEVVDEFAGAFLRASQKK
jgi:predicted metalloendopeptidase